MAEVFADEIREARTRTACAECGNKPGIPPALLAQIIKWLKDNNIDVPSRAAGVDRLLGQMPDLDELEKGLVLPFNRVKQE